MRRLGLVLAVAWVGAACDENFNDIYLGPRGGAAGVSGGSGQGGAPAAGAAGQGGASGGPVCEVGRCEMQQGTMVAVPCVQGRYDDAAREACEIGCHEGACVVVRQVAAGDSHSCAALSDGSVRCWGDNSQGQLGQGTTLPNVVKPVQVKGVSSVTAIAVSGSTSCALDGAGSVRCWGANDHSQTAEAGKTVSPSPFSVSLGKPAQKVALGASHGCALLEDGSVACWGRGNVGQLGEGHTGSEFQSPVPVAVKGLGPAKVVDLALGGDRSCALSVDAMNSGSVACWGAGLGTGEAVAGSASATKVSAVTASVSALATSTDTLCVVGPGGLVLCAGANDRGQLGHGDTDTTGAFVLVQGADGMTVGGAMEVSLGKAFGCLRQPSSVRCWGDNASGQLGAGAGSLQTRARSLGELGDKVVAVAAGRAHACAIVQERRGVQCWGANDAAQTGQGAPSPSRGVGSVVW